MTEAACSSSGSSSSGVGCTSSTSVSASSGRPQKTENEPEALPHWVQKVRTQVASLLPFLTFGQLAPVEVLVKASMPLPLPPIPGRAPLPTDASDAQEILSLDLITAIVEHVPSDPAIGDVVRAAFLRAGAVNDLLA